MTAIYAAAECPDLVAAALLVEPTLYAPFGLRHFKEPFEQRKAMAGKPVEELLAAGIQEMQVPLPVRERAARQLMKLDGATLGQTLDGTAFEGWDTDVLLKRVQCPVLLEHGERTVGAGLAASALYEGEVERARTLIPNCTVVEIKGSGHIPMAQQPGKFAEVASGFIQKIVARG
jgi:pimeloyl-ACP methyl ester carboxylesterase